MVVVCGTLHVQIEDQLVVLEEGDSMTFNSDAPHTFRNPTAQVTEVLTAISPPHF